MSSTFLQNFTTALVTLVLVCLAFFVLEQQYFTHIRARVAEVRSVPILAPIVPLGLHSAIDKCAHSVFFQSQADPQEPRPSMR